MKADKASAENSIIIRRTGGNGAVDESVVDAMTFSPGLVRASRAAEDRKLYARVMEPVWRNILTENVEAIDSAKELAGRMKDRPFPKQDYKRFSGGTGSSLDIPYGVSVFTPPYDYQRQGPTQGDHVSVYANPLNGTYGSDVSGENYMDGALGGSASIGIGVETPKAGTIYVRPFVEFDWSFGIGGLLLSSRSAGHVGHFVVAENGPVVSNASDYTAFDASGIHPSGYDGSSAEVLHPPYQEISFLAEANRRYQIWLWANVFGDQSGLDRIAPAGYSTMQGSLHASAPFVVVELR